MSVYQLGDATPELPEDDEYWIAPNAAVIGRVILKRNASVWWGATLRGDNDPIVIGENSNVQDGSVLHTDTGSPLTLGANVTVGHMVTLHGCTIGDNTLVGIGSIILNGARIGRNCLIGANCLITEGKEIPDNSLVMGAPGKVVRELSDAQAQSVALGARHYVENWKRYRASLRHKG
ncbi:MAG: gamma carbonic anhydrase family protein [Phenylobacterium sp.]|jgi:carbonic anhydrase/acetyltransferase-like protein (isoleucine patch superfamily)|uniref:gamma carbonic anhydrase family protein n=1 Tax=Phenylobacterium sp. TaxID=1871053 RepID=UPI0025F337CA|nr:gamma carbonic anhydrase family protein [Phenylobacterium sp.]MCA3716306.1 gamma carbonic anhydrase family protein [Phenylobacterium sp.]MCA3732034.1 gamma carbonic anhydrase family protein [Phenylobacterium sp.]MCA3737148.1 gamma carbonic anhydrase family protein [Phenylobacterium sp.]MCA3755021.1 gamma carbonic anhydrase family protein [Phenylobacterium sp.]MCA4917327.1 gamma carbonic anhydrase family protein [Phenylobacterium sp.]